MRNVTIHIEELVVHSDDHLDQAGLGAAVEGALAQMVGEQGVPAAWQQPAQIPSVDGGEIRTGGANQALGDQIARAVYGGSGT